MSDILQLAEAITRLLHAENILLLCHKNPDGDTLGSAAALYHALRRLGKTVGVLCSDPIPHRYDYMGITMFNNEFTPAFIVAVDVAGVQLFGEGVNEYTKRIHLCIDHHGTNSGYADAMLLDPAAAATAEIAFAVINALGVEIDSVIADCLYTGLSTDTGCFKFGNTTAQTHTIAAKLMELGAHTVELNVTLFESKSRRRLNVEKIALENLQFYLNDRCAMTYLTLDEINSTGADPNDLEGITGIPRAIEGVDVGITLRQLENGSYKVSVRTMPGIDAGAICARLGGGGHRQAAGCEIFAGLENAKSALLSEVEKHLCKE